jgi:hypothetical protein
MNTPDDVWIERFNACVLRWARERFAEELQTDFARAECFDNPRSREMLSVLRKRPVEDLKTLAEVLPLGVLSESPDAIERHNRLSPEVKVVVEKLNTDLDKDYREHFYESVAYLNRKDDKKIKAQFNIASQKGNQMVKEIASRWNCEAAGAARGEWGLILRKDWRRITISLKLARNMELGYGISISNLAASRRIGGGSYGGLLGFGIGGWDIESAEQFSGKLLKAIDFAWWQVQEFEKLISECSKESVLM